VNRHKMLLHLALLALLGSAPAAHAQWAVIDVGAIAQLIQQLATMRDELTTAQNELAQAKQEYSALTGSRGMQSLLPGVRRNYLPSSAGDLQALLGGGPGGYPAVALLMNSAISANAILTDPQLSALLPADAQAVRAQRRSIALLQALAGSALPMESGRFDSLQTLISAIGDTADPKASMDLQDRIAAEQTMLQNELAKLSVLFQAAQAQHWADRLRNREMAVAGHGDFGARFAPQP